MKIRLLARDSKLPNLAIMKISTYHKAKGDDVGWYDPLFDFDDTDILYESIIFSSTKPYEYYPTCEIIKGGTGADISKKLPKEIDDIKSLDYSLYPDCDYSIQFLSRGCIRKCPFCIVPLKEGYIKQAEPMELNEKGKYIKLLDNNFFACKEWRENIEILKSYKQPIEFNQGIDLRILNEEQCKAILNLKIKQVYCAWDNYEDKEVILSKLKMLIRYVKPYKITCYVLVGFEYKRIVETDIERVLLLKSLGVNPFAMGYKDFNNPKYETPKQIKDFCRWVNHKAIFKTVKWEDYNSVCEKR